MCYARLNSEATLVTITKSVSEKVGAIINGIQSHLWKTRNKKVAVFHVKHIPDHIDGVSDEEFAEIKKWVSNQLMLINNAYLERARSGVLGGIPVIKTGNKHDEKYVGDPKYIKDCKVGEFTGIINYSFQHLNNESPFEQIVADPAAKQEPKTAVHIVNLPLVTSSVETGKFVRELKAEGRLSELLDSVLYELGQIIIDSEGFPDETFSEKEMQDLYIAERQLFYFLVAGAMKQRTLEERAKSAAVEKFSKFKATRQGYAVGKVRHVSILMREFNSNNK